MNVDVQFFRSFENINGRSRSPWYWSIVFRSGHLYMLSPNSFSCLADAVSDFSQNGIAKVEEAESLHKRG